MAEEEEIHHSAAQDGPQQEEAHPPTAHRHGVDKDGGGDRQPEEQVQRGPQHPPVDARPQDPHQVV